jgi:hypothetical protein
MMKALSSQLDIVEAMNHEKLFAQWFPGDSWNGWRSVLKAAYALPMSDEEITFFRSVSGDREVPTKRCKELWVCGGRRMGKDSVASLILAFSAALFTDQHRLRPGEKAVCLCLACDREQAGIVLGYVKSYFQNIPPLREMVVNERVDGLELSNAVDIIVATNSYRSVRGRTILVAVFDEVAFWQDESSSRPDTATFAAVEPGLITLPGSMIIGISTPHKKSGLLFNKWKASFAKDDDHVLVVQPPSRTLNPTLPAEVIARATEDDPVVAAAEWNAEWRDDIAGFITMEVLDAVTDKGVVVRPPQPGIHYVAHVDSASGSGKDSFACCIAHAEKDKPVLDVAHEIRPPFSPTQAIEHISILLKSYRIFTVTGDRYAPGFVVEGFARCGIKYVFSEFDRSQIYLECLPLLTSGRAKLLDVKRMLAQFASLERRTLPTGRDRVDHPAGDWHDDLSNACAGALRLAASGSKSFRVSQEYLDRVKSWAGRGSSETQHARLVRENRERGWIPPEDDEDAA